MKRFTASQARLQLPKLMNDPKLLVGKKIHHLTIEDAGTEKWEVGMVDRIVKDNKNKMKVQYSVTYADDPDTEFTFPLLVDLRRFDH